ncbi:MAG: hypothetical protein D6736_13850, partial [Nitrospinota bacterium]
ALFGTPVTQEDHAERAVLAALDLLDALRQEETARSPSQIRIGVHTGPVLAWRIEHDSRTTSTEMGDTIHLAAQIQQLAGPGTILISETTRRKIGTGTKVKKIGTLQGTDPSDTLAVYHLLAPPTSFFQRGAQPDQETRCFVGRDQELVTLHDRLVRAEHGQGQVVGIVGEAGLGKSRLLTEFLQHLSAEQITLQRTYCLSYGRTMPYLPIRDLIRQLCGITETDSHGEARDKAYQCLQEAGMDLETFAPPLLDLLGLQPYREEIAGLSPETIQNRLFTLFRQLTLQASQHCPLLIVVENLHWIDQASEACLHSLVQGMAGASILLLATYRPGYRPPWIEKSYFTQITLLPLNPAESYQVVHSILPQLPDTITPLILDRAEGNPLFLEELTQAVAEQGVQTDLTIPDTIQGVLMARIDRLSLPAKRLLQTASVLGRIVSLPLLHAIWGGEDMTSLLQELQQREFLYEQVRGGERVYVFKHVLVQEAAYTSLPLTRRQALHAATGRALETLYAHHLTEVYDRLAYHYGRSRKTAKAVEYLRRFAEQAAHTYAHREALAALQEAYTRAQQLPTTEQDRCLVDLAFRQAFSLSVLGRFREVADLLWEQEERLQRLADPTLAGPYYFRLGLNAFYLGDYQQTAQSASRALQEAERCQDTVTLGQAHYVIALQSFSIGQFVQGMEHGRQAITLLQRTTARHWLGLAYWSVGLNAGFWGDFATTLAVEAQAYAIGETLADPRLQSFAQGISGWVLALRGDWEAGIAACQQSRTLAPDPVSRALATGYLGWAYLEKGDAEQAIPLLEETLQLFDRSGLPQTCARFIVILGEAKHQAGALKEAREITGQGLELTQRYSHRPGIGLAHRTLGRIAQSEGDFSTASNHLQQALQVFTTIQARFETGRTHLDLAYLARRQGMQGAMASHLHEAHRLFRTLQAPHYLEKTAHLANE